MPEKFEEIILAEPPVGVEQDALPEFDPQAFLVDNRLESLSDRRIPDHEGKLVPLPQAIADCLGARRGIMSALAMAKDLGAEDIAGAVGKFVDRMANEAQAAAPDYEAAKKKDS